MRARQYVWILALFVVGCAALGLPTPQTFNEKLLAAYSGVTQAREAGDILLNAKKISSADAANVQKQCDNVREGLDLAASMKDSTLATQKLTSSVAILTALQTYQAFLRARNP
jgi:hypothetical protein